MWRQQNGGTHKHSWKWCCLSVRQQGETTAPAIWSWVGAKVYYFILFYFFFFWRQCEARSDTVSRHGRKITHSPMSDWEASSFSGSSMLPNFGPESLTNFSLKWCIIHYLQSFRDHVCMCVYGWWRQGKNK